LSDEVVVILPAGDTGGRDLARLEAVGAMRPPEDPPPVVLVRSLLVVVVVEATGVWDLGSGVDLPAEGARARLAFPVF
jgi:hypothetical protein